MKFVSHLDMNRFMTRLVSKAKIPIWYTEGFNQHAYFNFAVPLSLGFEGEYEVLDLRVIDANYSNERLLEDLNAATVPGIEFWAAEEPVLKMKEITFAHFEILFEDLSQELKEKIEGFFSKGQIITKKTTKKGSTREIDIAPLVKKAEFKDNKLSLILTAGNENNLNPNLVMSAFFENEGIEPLYYSVTRKMIYDGELNPFR